MSNQGVISQPSNENCRYSIVPPEVEIRIQKVSRAEPAALRNSGAENLVDSCYYGYSSSEDEDVCPTCLEGRPSCLPLFLFSF